MWTSRRGSDAHFWNAASDFVIDGKSLQKPVQRPEGNDFGLIGPLGWLGTAVDAAVRDQLLRAPGELPDARLPLLDFVSGCGPPCPVAYVKDTYYIFFDREKPRYEP
jgi:hypothetical protein